MASTSDALKRFVTAGSVALKCNISGVGTLQLSLSWQQSVNSVNKFSEEGWFTLGSQVQIIREAVWVWLFVNFVEIIPTHDLI